MKSDAQKVNSVIKVNEYNNVKWGAGQKVLKSSVDRIKSSEVEYSRLKL